MSASRAEDVPLGRLVEHLLAGRGVEPARLAGLLGLHVPAVEAMIGSQDVVPAQVADRICRALDVAPVGGGAAEARVA